MDSCVFSFMADNKIEYKTEYELKEAVTFRTPSTAALALFPDTKEKLCSLVAFLKWKNVPFEIVGNGSNLFFATELYSGAVIFTKQISEVRIDGNTIVASAGASFTYLALQAAKAGLSGLEFAYGIPGTVGGAVYMNAGAYGGSVSDILVESTCFDGKDIRVVSLDEHGFGYRKSVYMQGGLVCLDAKFILKAGDREEI